MMATGERAAPPREMPEQADAIAERICDETGGVLRPGGFVMGLGAGAPLSAELRDATLAYVQSLVRVLADDVRACAEAEMPIYARARLEHTLSRARDLAERLARDVAYPNVFVVAELVALKRDMGYLSFHLNNAWGEALAAGAPEP